MLVTFTQCEFFYQGNDREKPQRGKLLANAVGGESFHSLACRVTESCQPCLCERLGRSRGLRVLSLPRPRPGLPAPDPSTVLGAALRPRWGQRGAFWFTVPLLFKFLSVP